MLYLFPLNDSVYFKQYSREYIDSSKEWEASDRRTKVLEIHPSGQVTMKARRDFWQDGKDCIESSFKEVEGLLGSFYCSNGGSRANATPILSFCRSKGVGGTILRHGLATFAISRIVSILKTVLAITMKILLSKRIGLVFVSLVPIVPFHDGEFITITILEF